jgi:DNA-binding GntR family transcriptional regulator
MTLPFLGRTAPLSDQVAEVLAERVLAGMWPAGHHIPSEPELDHPPSASR